MTGYHEDDPRTQFHVCPSCRADIDRNSSRCEFCNCEFDFEPAFHEPDTRLASSEEEVNTDKRTRYLVLLTLNIATGLVGVLASSLEEAAPTRLSPPESPQISEEQREEMVRYLQQQCRAHVEELNACKELKATLLERRSVPIRF